MGNRLENKILAVLLEKIVHYCLDKTNNIFFAKRFFVLIIIVCLLQYLCYACLAPPPKYAYLLHHSNILVTLP